jgi:hypothetical protein
MDQSDKEDIQRQIVDAKFQLTVLQNLMTNFFVLDSTGKKRLRPNVKEKDIEMLSDAILKIETNFKEVMSEMALMQQREAVLDSKYSKTRDGFIMFAKDTGVKIPKFFKDFYQIDG